MIVPPLTPETAKQLASRMNLSRRGTAAAARKLEILSVAVDIGVAEAKERFGEEAVPLDGWLANPLDSELRIVRTRHEAALADGMLRAAFRGLAKLEQRIQTDTLSDKDLIDGVVKLVDKAAKVRDVHQRLLDSEREFANAVAEKVLAAGPAHNAAARIEWRQARVVEPAPAAPEPVLELPAPDEQP